ncbi:type II toxin-antitoxin system HicA family toxin [Nodularia sp. UHCC 0506]|uniref:type II toxin-antitoxin system HicA family toxin n=1 Tax=Nodularia sp. UHCC 0506 TaxID=3110243 RepID=UPI002B206B0A|nr:type II toxin-antitoxin system HicA family toxin [Nodularia sp. UHCC 0506]MEA5515883.1 type II toxin-antitoxin system HicA family toxin [Nodularia sp. UHCC 0506]
MNLNSKQQSILNAIFENPVRANIPWNDIESMLIALGTEVSEGKGSRVRFALNGIRATFHRPHPEKETDKGAVKSVRRFLMEAEVVKNDEV